MKKDSVDMGFKIDISSRLLHFKQPATTSRGAYVSRRSFYVSISAPDAGPAVGTGECATLPDLSCDALPALEYERRLRGFCNRLEETGELDREALRTYPSMLFGLESALAQWKAGGSIDLFDTPFGKGEEGITVNGLVWMGSFDEMIERLNSKIESGFRCIKLKIGAIDFGRELELINVVRQSFASSEIELRVDANGAFAPDVAMNRLEKLAAFDIHSIEQPIAAGQWAELARLCAESPLPIALDEELIGINRLDEKERLLDALGPQYIVLKPSLHGGISGTEEWIRLAGERGMGSWITSALESNVGLNAIAQLAARVYPNSDMAQGLGTGQLFEDNIPMPLEMRGDKLWINI